MEGDHPVNRVPRQISLVHPAKLCLSLLALPVLAGCNLFSFLDGPGNSAQYLSRARACLDAGDIECARENYAKVSGDFADEARSEEAFTILTDEGIELGDFFGALTASSGSGSGASINALANKMAALNPGAAKREALFRAYRLSLEISDASENLRGLTKLVTTMSLVAEILAETADANGNTTFEASDLVNGDADACAVTTACETEANCAISTQLDSSTDALEVPDWEDGTITSLAGEKPSMDMIRSGLNALNTALGELGQDTSGGSTGETAEFGDEFEQLEELGYNTTDAVDQCYMNALLEQGIGG